jgi:4-amino-4-deoxy-L-arabinose transferase-like glycosyltransferase
MKTLFGFSYDYLFKQSHWLSYEGLSYRLPAMVIAGLCIALVAFWGARSLSRTAGIVAALSLALMPRFFHHAHLACFDVPVASLCLASAFTWSKALDSGKLRWSLLLGLVYGLTLATKHNAWLLPPAFFLHAALVRGTTFWRGTWSTRLRLLLPVLSLVTLGPLVLYALWPWLWFQTSERLQYWYEFHARHEYYNMEFLGFTYWKPPMPLAYAWVMTLATVPLTTLSLFAYGVFVGTRSAVASLAHTRKPLTQTTAPVNSDLVLWGICILAFYSPWLKPETPIFGGTKHWMTAYPFLALVAGFGFHAIAQHLTMLASRWRTMSHLLTLRIGLAALVLLPSFVIVKDMGPWGLSTYTPIVGGASGAATLGLNRTFWGYTTVALAADLTARAPARLYLHDMTGGALDMEQRDDTLPRNLYGTLSITESDLALYHHEPHMERVEYQIWSAYGKATPASIGVYQGVPVVWLYDRRDTEK